VGGISLIGYQKLNFVRIDAGIKISRKGANELLFFCFASQFLLRNEKKSDTFPNLVDIRYTLINTFINYLNN
jgi:hypothetical protein